MVNLLRLPEEETLATIVAMGYTLVPIYRQRLVCLIGTVRMTFGAKLLLLSVVGNAECFQFLVIYFQDCCFLVVSVIHIHKRGCTQILRFALDDKKELRTYNS